MLKKILLLLLCCVIVCAVFVSCGNKSGDIYVITPDGSPLLSIAKMRSDNGQIDGRNVTYETVSAELLAPSLLKGEPDFAIAPINVAALMFNNGSGYRLAGITVWGIYHIVSNQDVSAMIDLKGRTIYAFGQFAVPGITLRAILKSSGITYEENKGAAYAVPANTVHIIYLPDAVDVRNAIVAGSVDGVNVEFGLLAEPVVTAISGQTGGQFISKINLQTEWKKRHDNIFPQAVLIFHERLLDKNSGLVEKFIEEVIASEKYVMDNPFEAGELMKTLGSASIPNGNIVRQAVNAGRLDLTFAHAENAKTAVMVYLNAILGESPTLIGGKLPADGFFYAKKD